MAFWNKKKKSKTEIEKDLMTKTSKSLDEQIEKTDEQIEKRKAIFNGQRPDADDYGYSSKNPICTFTIADSNKYLARLFTEDGEKLYWVRTGAYMMDLFGVPDVMIDYYQLFLHGEKHSEIYICPYALSSSYVPKGMALAEEDPVIGSGNLEKESRESGISIEQILESQKMDYELNELRKKTIEIRQNQAGQVSKHYPQFNLSDSLKDETFVALINCGVDMKTAYEYIHRNELFYLRERSGQAEIQKSSDEYYDIMFRFEDSLRERIETPSTKEMKKEAKSKGVPIGRINEYVKSMAQLNSTLAAIEEENWQRIQGNINKWSGEAVELSLKYPEFHLEREYSKKQFRDVLNCTSMETAYEIEHFQELFVRKP